MYIDITVALINIKSITRQILMINGVTVYEYGMMGRGREWESGHRAATQSSVPSLLPTPQKQAIVTRSTLKE